MQLSHAASTLSAVFDEPNLISCAGLAPVLALAHRCGLAELVGEHLTLKEKGGVNAPVKVPALVAGMVAGADSIADMDLLRHGGMGRLCDGIRAPSTLGTFVRTFTFGHVRQLDAIAARLLVRLAAAAPVLPGADERVFVDVDDTICPTYGYAKQGAGRGLQQGQGHQRAAGHDQLRCHGAGDRRHPAASRGDQLCPRRGPAGRRRVGRSAAGRSVRVSA